MYLHSSHSLFNIFVIQEIPLCQDGAQGEDKLKTVGVLEGLIDVRLYLQIPSFQQD